MLASATDWWQALFAWPWLLLALPLPLLVPCRGQVGGLRGGPFARLPASATGSGRRPLWLWVAWSATVLGAAQPGPLRLPQPLPPLADSATVLAVDLSPSMSDAVPGSAHARSRLDLAVELARAWMVQSRGARIGLVVFAGKAWTLVPPTAQHSAVEAGLRMLRAESVGEATGLVDASWTAVEELSSLQPLPSTRQILLLSDGLDNRSSSAAERELLRAAAEWRIPVHALGLGKEAPTKAGVLQTLTADTGGTLAWTSQPWDGARLRQAFPDALGDAPPRGDAWQRPLATGLSRGTAAGGWLLALALAAAALGLALQAVQIPGAAPRRRGSSGAPMPEPFVQMPGGAPGRRAP